MPATPNQQLYELVQAMTAAEKSYFRKNARRFSAENDYLRLFELVEQQPQYNEAALTKVFPRKQFSAFKNYLYEAITDSLIAFRADKSEEQRLQRLKQKALLLAEKRLYEAALKILKKASLLALEGEFFTIAIELVQLEYKLFTNWRPLHLPDYQAAFKKVEFCLAQLHNQQIYQQLNLEFIYWQRKERVLRDVKVLEELEKVMQKPHLQDFNQATNILSKLFYWTTHDGYHKIKGEFEQAILCSKQAIQLYENNPIIQRRDPQNYLTICINHLNNAYYTHNIEELKRGAIQLKNMLFNDAKLENIRLARYAGFMLSYMKFSKNYTEFNALIKEIKDFINKKNTQITEKRLLGYNTLELCIKKKDYTLALDFVFFLTHLPATDTQADLQRFVRLLEILVHSELGNDFLVDSLCLNTARLLSKNNVFYDFESLWVELFQQLIKAPLLERKTLKKQYISKFQVLNNINKHLEYFDILEWLQ